LTRSGNTPGAATTLVPAQVTFQKACTNCGAALQPGWTYCSQCGAPVN
jgi:predicted amidophosphoribosyltransferase